MLDTFLEPLAAGQHLSESESTACLSTIFDSECAQSEIEQLLSALHTKGESTDEIVGFAKAMRAKMTPVTLNKDAIDLCGTGGSGKSRFNVSTAAAFVLASMGISVAKHGNRGSKQPNGSFDFLEALGLPIELSSAQCETAFSKTNLCFLFARMFHPAMGKVAPARKALGHRTIFNLLGPLCNPAGVTHQIIGCADEAIAKKLAPAIQRLGSKRVILVVGHNGLDELSTTGTSKLIDVRETAISESMFDPAELGLSAQEPEAISGLSGAENAALFKSVFQAGDVSHPIATIVALNAGLAAYCVGNSLTIADGVMLAQTAIRSKVAWAKFEDYRNSVSAL
ncbi:MAG: anthranilate phosphoribosyltransferase [bacterium]|nr:anthranilate phosphoribosyltransferase [bacterium]